MNPGGKIDRMGDALAIANAFQRLDPTVVVPDKIPPLYGEVSTQATKALSQACLSTVHPLALELAAGLISGKITQFVPPEPAYEPKPRTKFKAKAKVKKRKPKVRARAKTKKKARKRR